MADHVPDSTDWLNTPLPGLSALDAALRCHVCKDFYQTPMVTDCSHTFCSICIRRALSNDGKCPMCRSSQQENKLRNNTPLGEAVEAFVRARPTVLDFAKNPSSIEALPSTSPKRKLLVPDEPNKRLRTSARLSRLRGAEVTTGMSRMEVESQLIPLERGKDYREGEGEDESYIPDDGLVSCPICLQRMKEVAVSRHLDTTCPGEPRPNRHPNAPLNTALPVFRPLPAQLPKSMERLPAINYSMLKDQALRKKLNELGIPAHGPRQIVEKRHKEWMTIWNANCDSSHPKKRSELLRVLDTWERTQGALAPTSKAVVVGSKIKDKDFDAAAWSAEHSDEFKRLVANARKSRENARQKEREKEKDESSDLVGDIQAQVEGPTTKADPEAPAPGFYASPDIPRYPNRAPLATAQEIDGVCGHVNPAPL